MKSLKDRSIRTKLIMIIFSIAFISQLIVFSVLFIERNSYLKNELETNSRVLAKLIAEYCISPLMFDDIEGVYDILTKIDALPIIYSAAVYNKTGELLNSCIANSDISAIAEREEHENYDSSTLFHIVEPIIYQGDRYGTIHLQVSKADIKKTMLLQLLFFFILAFAMAILILAAARKMQNYISRPILYLSETAKSITLDEEFPVDLGNRSGDEIGLLYESFDNMVKKVNKRREERDIALENVEEQYERFLTILNSFPQVIYVVDPKNYKILFVNTTLEKLFEYELIGKKCFEAFHNNSEVCSFCKMKDLKEVGDEVIWEHHNTVLDRIFLVMDKLIKWPDDRVVSMEVAIDITERKKNEQELLKHREHLEELVKERTAELEKNNRELEKFNKVFVGREFRIKELRDKLKELEGKQTRPQDPFNN